VDSLIEVCKTSKQDSDLVKRYFQICSHYYDASNMTELHRYATLAKDLALKVKDPKRAVTAYNFIGVAYKEMSNFSEALNNYLKGLEIAQKHGLTKLTVNLYDNIGNVYAELGQSDKALDYYYLAISALPDKKNKRILQTYNNIAVAYSEKGDMKNARNYFQKVYDIAKANNDLSIMEGPIGNLGTIYLAEGDTGKALDHFNQALNLSRQIGDLTKEALWLQNIGSLVLQTEDIGKAERYFKESLAISDSAGLLSITAYNHEQLSLIYERSKKPELALKHYELSVNANDSIFNSGNSNKIVQLEMNYEFRAKEQEAKLLQEKKDAIKAEEHKRNNFIILSFSLVIILIGCLAFYVYRSYKAKQKANNELLGQKNIIEEKQQEILASIQYAKRIQNALLTSESYIHKTLERLTDRNA
jgi:tetratricopeptide (TPR) repeat protein